MKRKIIIQLMFAGVLPAAVTSVPAQNLDSLEQVVNTGKPEMQMQALNEMANYYLYENIPKAMEYAWKEKNLAEKEKNRFYQGEAFNRLATIYYTRKMIDSALYYFEAASHIWEELDDMPRLANSWADMGAMQARLNRPNEAIENNLKMLDYYRQQEDNVKIAIALMNIANAYLSTENREKFRQYTLEAIEVQKKTDDKIGLGIAYYNLCQSYLGGEEMNFPEGLMYGEKAIETFREEGNTYYIGMALILVCRYILSTFEILDSTQNEKVRNYLTEAAAIAEALDNEDMNYLILFNEAHFELNALNFKKAKSLAENVLNLTDSVLRQDLLSAYVLLLYCSIRTNEQDDAIAYYKQYDSLRTKMYQQEWTEKISEMEVKYETEKKDLEIERQQMIISQQNLQRGLLAGGIALTSAILVLLWYMLRLRTHRNHALTERNTTLTEMNVTKDKFFNIISHDLKNPTIALHDNLKLLVNNVRLWDADTLNDFSNELLKSTEGQVELLNSLLNWARIQTGRITYTPVTFDLVARLRTDILLVRKLAENKGVTLAIQTPDNALVTGDSNMLVTVIRNLLTNAIKFTAPGGTVTLAITADCADSSDSSDTPILHSSKYVVAVSDTGTGMTPEQIANLFRLDKPQTRRGTAGEEGSGLGLIVCKELLDKHGSLLHIKSEEGKGSKFWFTALPPVQDCK